MRKIEDLQFMLFEGDIVSLGGVLAYNMNSGAYSLTEPFVLVGGGAKNLAIYFKNMAKSYATGATWFGFATMVLGAFAGYYFLKGRNKKRAEKMRR